MKKILEIKEKELVSIEVQDDKIIINLKEQYVPKEGEYFYVKSESGNEFIAIKKDGSYITTRYCSCMNAKNLRIEGGYVCDNSDIEEIRPATKEEVEILDKLLEDDNKKWNPETKQIEKLPKVGDFCIFWEFNDTCDARCGVLEKIEPTHKRPYLINHGIYFANCTPFQSIEHYKEFISQKYRL